MNDEYLRFLARKQQEKCFIEGLIRDYSRTNPSYFNYANRLHYCSNQMLITPKSNGQSRILPIYPCGVPFCPMCDFFKTRRKVAQCYDIYHRITQRPEMKNTAFYFLTLTVKECHASELVDTVIHMKKGYSKLRRKQVVKTTSQSASCFLHYGLNADNYIRPHFHVLLTQKMGRNYIKKADWLDMWIEAMELDYEPHIHLEAVGKRGHAQLSDFINIMQYGLKSLDYEDIKHHPDTFIALFDIGRSIRKESHQGVIKDVKKESREDYQQNRIVVTSSNSSLLKFDGSKYV